MADKGTRRLPSFEYIYIPKGPRISSESENIVMTDTLNVSAGLRKTIGKNNGDGIFENEMNPSVSSSPPIITINHIKKERAIAPLLVLEIVEIKNPIDIKTNERRSIKIKDKRVLRSISSNPEMRKAINKERETANADVKKTEKNLEK